MPEIADVGASSHIFMLIHGDPGVGKTTFIGSGGGKYKILLIRSPIDHADPIVGSGVKETIVRNWEEILDVLEYLRHEGHNWDWVWFDSISLTQDIGLDDVYQTAVDAKESPQARKNRARFGPDKGEYRINMWRLEQFVRHAVGSGGFNFGITAHSFWLTQTDELSGDTQTSLWPWIQGKAMPQKIGGMMNLVGYMEVVNREIRGETRPVRIIHFDKSPRWYAKSQFKFPNGQPAFGNGDLANPSLDKIVEVVGQCRANASANRPVPITAAGGRGVTRRRTRG